MTAAVLLFLGCDPAQLAKFDVGVSTVGVEDLYNRQRLTVEIWTPIQRDAADKHRAADGKFPVLLFSHGFAGVRGQSAFLCKHLASHGYIVAAPDHPATNFGDLRPFRSLESVRKRPFELRATLDFMQSRNRDADAPWFDKWDGRAGAVGHSLGGFTALAAAGAWIDAKSVAKRPTDPPALDYIDAGDDRIQAAAALNPFSVPFLTTESCRRLVKPTFILGCSHDPVTPVPPNQTRVYERLAGPKCLGVLLGGSHLSAADEAFVANVPFYVRAFDRPTLPRKTAERIIVSRTTAFFDRYVKGDLAAERWLKAGEKDLIWSARP
jgi:predicted dienelactone hydrolase